MEFGDDAIVSIGFDEIVTTWNTGAERIYGYAAEEIVGKSILLIIPPNRREEEARIPARVQQGERVEHYDTIRTCRDGSPA